MASILITGGAGYIGSVLTERLLQHGHEVTVLDNLMYNQNSILYLSHHRNFQFIKGDARNKKLVSSAAKDKDFVIPLAAIVGAPACDRNPDLATETNLGAIRDLMDFLSTDQKIVFPNTNSGYGTKDNSQYCTEESPLEPVSLYGRLKVDAEKSVLSRKNSIVLRLATVFGVSPRMRIDLLVNDFTYRAVKDGYIVLFEKDFKRNYIHIRDIAKCFEFCMENFEKMRGQIYNVGRDDANCSKEELALRIKKYLPSLKIVISEVGKDPDRRNYIVSNDKINKAGFECEYTLDDGIQELIKGYKILYDSAYTNL
jgi:nucleoside-diphosphate-sugar epimerase